MIVDTHTHLLDQGHWPREWWRWVAEDWARKAPGRDPSAIEGRIEANLLDPAGARMVAAMDDAGVDMSVVLPIDWGPDFSGTKPIRTVVQHAMDVSRRHPGRFVPFGGIDPRRPEATDLVTEWFEAGARGLKLYPSCGWHPTSDEAAEVYGLCAERRVPVLFHTGDPLPVLDRTNSDPSLLREVASAYPDMPVWLGHAGAHRWWDEALQLAVDHPNVRLEMSVWIWDDSSEADVNRFVSHIAEALEAVGPRQLLYGTDHVSGPKVRGAGFLRTVTQAFEELPRRLAALDVTLSEADLGLVLGGNALRDLGAETAGARCA